MRLYFSCCSNFFCDVDISFKCFHQVHVFHLLIQEDSGRYILIQSDLGRKIYINSGRYILIQEDLGRKIYINSGRFRKEDIY